MTVSRRRFAATGVALALTLALGACTPGDEGSQGPEAVSIEGVAPLTVQEEGAWTASVLEDAPVKVTSHGVLTFSAEESVPGKSYVPVLLSSETGSPRWTGEAITSEAMPTLDWVQQGHDRWAVAKTVAGNKVSLYSWNGLASHAEAGITASNSFEGKKKPPTVTISPSGVLVTGADKTAAEPLIFWPKDASTTRYKGGPERGGKAGVPIGVYGSGFLVAFPGGGFSLATATGGWTSTSATPNNANPQSGAVLTQWHGFVISEWTRPSDQDDGTTVLAVHSASSGRLFAQYEVPKEEASVLAAQKADGASLVTDDSRWLVWGQIGFDLNKGGATVYGLEQGVPTAVVDDMLYVRDAYTLIPQPDATPAPSDGGGEASDGGGDEPASASPEPSAEETIDPEAPDGFRGVTGIDLLTSQPLSGLPSLYPIGRSSTGQVILRDTSKPSVYSVGLR